MNPEDIMLATDEEIEALETSVEEPTEPTSTEPSEEAGKGNSETNTPAESSETEEPKEEPKEDSDTPPPSAILEMSDEDFEKYVAESEKFKDDEESSTPSPKEEPNDDLDDLTPSLEELKAKAKQLEENLKNNDVLNKNRELVEALDVNGLLSPEKVNRLIGIAKGDKKALVALLDEQGIDVSSLTEPDSKSKKETSTNDDEIDFESWLSSDDDEPEDNPEESEPTDEGDVDYLDKLATDKVGKMAVAIIQEFGQETLNGVDAHIDVPSFEMLKRNPEDLRALAEQKKSGVMDMINERIQQMDAQGVFPQGIPYLTKYQLAGNLMIQEAKEPQKPIDRRVATTESAIDYKLKHAQSSTSSTTAPKGSKEVDPYNIFTMPEEEFNKLK